MPLKSILLSFFAAIVGSISTIAVGAFGYLNIDRSHDIEMVRISLSIMQGENKETSLQGRNFALRALAKYSNIEIPKDEFAIWAKSGTIPQTIKLNPNQGISDFGTMHWSKGFDALFITPCVAKKLSRIENPTTNQRKQAHLECSDSFVIDPTRLPNQ